jgi:hypothetical protein
MKMIDQANLCSKAQASDKALKGRFICFSALITGRAVHDYKGSFENGKA